MSPRAKPVGRVAHCERTGAPSTRASAAGARLLTTSVCASFKQLDKRDLKTPTELVAMPAQASLVYRWMLQTFNPKAKQLQQSWQPSSDSTCNLTLLEWA